MIERLMGDLVSSTRIASSDRTQALLALEAALSVHRQLAERLSYWVDQYVRFVPAWQADLGRWTRQLAQGSYTDNADLLPPQATLLLGDDAAREFGVRSIRGAVRLDVDTPPRGQTVSA
jgi:hypothetical protein